MITRGRTMKNPTIYRAFLLALGFGLFAATILLPSGAVAEEEFSEADGTDVTKVDTALDRYLEKVPPFEVAPRIPKLEDGDYYPCSDCHDPEVQVPNPKIRVLEDEHDLMKLNHGDGRFWCLTCHSKENRDTLQGFKDQAVSFDKSYLVCGQCHFRQQMGLFYGSHGKRLDTWKGDRLLQTCVECHNPHDPAIKAAKPYPAPKPRRGLSKPTVTGHGLPPIWKKYKSKTDEPHH